MGGEKHFLVSLILFLQLPRALRKHKVRGIIKNRPIEEDEFEVFPVPNHLTSPRTVSLLAARV